MQKSFDFKVDLPKPKQPSNTIDSKQFKVVTPAQESVRPSNEGGVEAIQGLEYQHQFAVQKCLEMLNAPEKITTVSSETHEDVVVEFNDGSMEFYQVKLRRGSYWSISELHSHNVWENFLKLQRIFGTTHKFFFVSEQAAYTGKNHKYDLGQMKKLTSYGLEMCNERDLVTADYLINQLYKLPRIKFVDYEEARVLFWNTRILTDFEHYEGIKAKNTNLLEGILNKQGNLSDLENRNRICLQIRDKICNRVKAPPEMSYKEALQYRQITCRDVLDCLAAPFRSNSLPQFIFNDNSDNRTLVEKMEKAKFHDSIRSFFLESRNYFAYLFSTDQLYAAPYLANLRLKVWNICNEQKLKMESSYRPVAEYNYIKLRLEELAEAEQKANAPINVDFNYLHGMLCQLTAECHHDWIPFE